MAEIRTKGFNEIQRDLQDAQAALASLNGPIAEIPINPSDPESVQQAIRKMEEAVDRKVAPYGNNRLVAAVVTAAKDEYRKALLKRFGSSQ